jgi:hypothetical protein
MRRTTQKLLVAWFGVLVALPLVLFAFGVRTGSFENRTLAPLPHVSPRTLVDGGAVHGLDDYVLDRLPLRGRAVEVRARVAYDVFRDSPNPRVIVGSGHWLFFRDELDTCRSRGPGPAGALAAIRQLDERLAASGRRLVFAIAPDKIGIYADRAGTRLADERCAVARSAALRAGVAAVRAPWLPDLFGALERAREGGDVYYATDTHWDDRGRVAALQAVVDAAQAGVAGPADVVSEGADRHAGDLLLLLGLRRVEVQPRLAIDRRTRTRLVAGAGLSAYVATHRYVTTGTAPLVADRAVLIADSQGFNGKDFIVPYFRDVTMCHWRIFSSRACADAIRRARLVVVETTERDLYHRIRPLARAVDAALR